MRFVLLDAKAVIFMHDEILKQGKGLPGVSGDKSLEAALHRIEARDHYESLDDVFEVAAFYGICIAQGHLFVDANKRTAFMSMYVFLEINGYSLIASDYNTENEEMMEKIVKKEINEKQLADWLRRNSKQK